MLAAPRCRSRALLVVPDGAGGSAKAGVRLGPEPGSVLQGLPSRFGNDHDAGVSTPETKYAKASDGVSLAYQVVGEGPIDLLWLDGMRGNLEVMWEQRLYSSFFTKLSAGCRVIRFDMRGTGLSDRGIPPPDLETHMEDACCVLDFVGSQRTVIVGHAWGTEAAGLFASTFPLRTVALVLVAASARNRWAPDYPWGFSEEVLDRSLLLVESSWGTDGCAAREVAFAAPSMLNDRDYIRWVGKVQRHWIGPSGAAALERQFFESDVREALRSVQVPTLVVAREWDDPEEDAYVAELIPQARLVRLPGREWIIWVGDQDSVITAIQQLLAAKHPTIAHDRVLATVLFTDIVGSTEAASRLGDAEWKKLLAAHDDCARAEIERFRGRYVHTTGDGLLATFDGPARAVRCAQAIGEAVGRLGLQIRAGCHTGEIELADDDIQGLSVHVGARVVALAAPSEVLVSSTLKDLVAGSGLTFEDAGEHELKGVPDRWHLYRAIAK